MGLETYTDGEYKTFEAAVPADLVGKEGYVVEGVAGAKTIQLYTSGIALGVLVDRAEGSGTWRVKLCGSGGTVKVIANGVIANWGQVMAENGGKVVAATATNRSIGVKCSPAASAAAGDVIEIINVVEVLKV